MAQHRTRHRVDTMGLHHTQRLAAIQLQADIPRRVVTLRQADIQGQEATLVVVGTPAAALTQVWAATLGQGVIQALAGTRGPLIIVALATTLALATTQAPQATPPAAIGAMGIT